MKFDTDTSIRSNEQDYDYDDDDYDYYEVEEEDYDDDDVNDNSRSMESHSNYDNDNDDDGTSMQDFTDYDVATNQEEEDRSHASTETSGSRSSSWSNTSNSSRSRSKTSHDSRSSTISGSYRSGRRRRAGRTPIYDSDPYDDDDDVDVAIDGISSRRQLRSIDENSEQDDTVDYEFNELFRGVSLVSGSINTHMTIRQDDDYNDNETNSSHDSRVSKHRRGEAAAAAVEGSISTRQSKSVDTTTSRSTSSSRGSNSSSRRSSTGQGTTTTSRSSRKRRDDDNSHSRPQQMGTGRSTSSFSSRTHSDDDSRRRDNDNNSRSSNSSNRSISGSFQPVNVENDDNVSQSRKHSQVQSSGHQNQQQTKKVQNGEERKLLSDDRLFINDDDDGGGGKRVRSIAILGTMSDVGKSVIAAGICRILVNGGIRVAPFKAQNMSNNASPALLPDPIRRERLYKAFERAVGGKQQHLLPATPTMSPLSEQGYGEIGTAQSIQAEACKIVPRVEMNPVLLKSGGQNERGENMCSVIVLGKQIVRETYGDLGKRTSSLLHMVLESHKALAEATDANVVVMEGAGSCTELNLMDRDIANLPLVRSLKAPWILVANIDSGGAFAQIVGTKMCVSERDWDLCVGVIVNKLRGDVKNFEPGKTMLERMVGKPIFVVPFLQDLNLPEEDGLGIERRLEWEKTGSKTASENGNGSSKKPVVVVVAYPHTAIADDLCPLEQDARFHVEWRRKRVPKPYPATTAVILPGSRLTNVDLKWLQDSGWADFIRRHAAAGGSVLGICGGYQMLGSTVKDPTATEGSVSSRQGIGLLPVSTTIRPPECKIVTRRRGQLYPSGVRVEGFELHCGISEVIAERATLVGKNPGIAPLLALEKGQPEGMRLGNVQGTYLHGILRSDKARVELLVPNKKVFPSLKTSSKVEDPLDRFAQHLESCGLDYRTLQKMMYGAME